MIIYKDSPGRGRGVFAQRRFQRGDIIERVPVIVIPATQRPLIAETILNFYQFEWGEDGKETAIALGYGSLYNHSYQPNAHFRELSDRLEIEFVALRRIAKGEEIFINYNGDPSDMRPIVFEGSTWRSDG